MRYVVAVSGGVDSVVLLDMLAQKGDTELIVAHFDHGIRKDSAKDADFVGNLVQKYNLPFETRREELGENASEELARDRRYEFLRTVAKKYKARLMTAHHSDDAIESIVINLKRGTGWRGLAVLDSDIERPLIDKTKEEIIDYAKEHSLEWREDSTNLENNYLRNRVRRLLGSLDDDTKRQILALRAKQTRLRRLIDAEVDSLVGGSTLYSRYFLIQINPASAIECLRYITRGYLTRPQAERALLAVKTARPGTVYDVGGKAQLSFTTRNFTVKVVK